MLEELYSRKRKKRLKLIQKRREYRDKIKKTKADKNTGKEKEVKEDFDGVGKGFSLYYPPQNKYCENKVFPGSYLTPLLPTAMVFVSYGFVLVQVQVPQALGLSNNPLRDS